MNIRLTLAGVTVAVLSGIAWPLLPANAATPAVGPTCTTPTGWYVNSPDEDDRAPEWTTDGAVFTGTDLTHHATDHSLINLTHGTYTADPAPDQPSFFSIEVRDATTGGYGTLRWNATTNAWDLTSGSLQVSHPKASDFIGEVTKFGKLTDKTRVISFGVGYTANPPGTVSSTVTTVRFLGVDYDLTCTPVATPSSKPPTTTPTTRPTTRPPTGDPSPTYPTVTAPVNPGGGGDSGTGALAITGPHAYLWAIWGAVLVGLGLVAFLARRRKIRFKA